MAKDIVDVPPDQGGKPDSNKPDWALTRRERERDRRAREGLPTRRRWWHWALLVLLLAAAAGVGLWLLGLGQAPDAPPAIEALAVPAAMQVDRSEYVTIEPATLRRTLRVIGPIAPSRRADLSAQTSGEVESVSAQPGDRVTAGEALVQVDVERLSIDLSLARSNAEATRAQLSLAEGQLQRSQALVERGVASTTTLDEATSSAAVLRASLAALDDQVSAAQLALARATVRAPFDGVVASRSVEPGAVVAVGTPLLSVVDLSEVEMLATAPVAAGPSIRPGQVVEVAVDGVSGRTFEGEVERVAPVANEGTRTITVFVRLDNPDGTLLGGMFATGTVVLAERRDAVALPRRAIREDDAGSYVLTVAEGAVARRDVEVGEAWEGGLLEVARGLEPGDVVVTVDLPELEPGEAVNLVEF